MAKNGQIRLNMASRNRIFLIGELQKNYCLSTLIIISDSNLRTIKSCGKFKYSLIR
jgi:hypothetical protein